MLKIYSWLVWIAFSATCSDRNNQGKRKKLNGRCCDKNNIMVAILRRQHVCLVAIDERWYSNELLLNWSSAHFCQFRNKKKKLESQIFVKMEIAKYLSASLFQFVSVSTPTLWAKTDLRVYNICKMLYMSNKSKLSSQRGKKSLNSKSGHLTDWFQNGKLCFCFFRKSAKKAHTHQNKERIIEVKIHSPIENLLYTEIKRLMVEGEKWKLLSIV